jgi:uncharacterized LabA/DUF88 family protein
MSRKLFIYNDLEFREELHFLGYIGKNENMYAGLRNYGYEIIFKPTLYLPSGEPKGNVDAELVLHTMIEYPNFDRAIIVAGDGDYYCLIKHLIEKNKLERLIIPDKNNYSSLLRQFNKYIIFVEDFKGKVEFRKH